ncbi:MAG: 50S ribosomal protein L11 methyltransferase [Chloroflexi bacterium]|nr:50S ribosomal protein L11 methyltransferase [Chloroflexota bacterium]
MQWWEFTAQAEEPWTEAVSGAFHDFCREGVWIEPAPPQALIGFPTPGVGVSMVRGYFPVDDSLSSRLWEFQESLDFLQSQGFLRCWEKRAVESQDWEHTWRRHFPLQHIGQRLVIKPSWRSYAPKDQEVVVELDPGIAFGTGLHPTTRMCLALLEQRLRPGDRVLDLGTGSGILAIAAAGLGAAHIDARDVDPVAVKAARENAAKNGVEGLIQVSEGTLAPHPPLDTAFPTYELVLANIYTNVLTALAESLARALAPEGSLIISGYIDAHQAQVEGALEAAGLTLTERARQGEWHAAVARLAPRPPTLQQ